MRLKFVVNKSGSLMGVVSADDLSEDRLMQRVSRNAKLDDVELTDLMIPRRDLMALDFDEIKNASISEVIGALKDHGARHCLVIDKVTQKIRGIFSASDVSRKLQLSIDILDVSNFYKVFSLTA